MRYSLYHRAGNPRTQTDEDARKIVESSVLPGYAPQGSDIPTVQAWPGEHPAWRVRAGVRDRRVPRPAVPARRPNLARRLPRREGWRRERGPYAEITIRVTRVVLSTEVDK